MFEQRDLMRLETAIERTETLYWGAGGIAVYFIGQFLVGPMPRTRVWALYSFAASLPLLAAGASPVARIVKEEDPRNAAEWWCSLLGPVFFLLGVGLTMLSFSPVASGLFVVALVVAFIAYWDLWPDEEDRSSDEAE